MLILLLQQFRIVVTSILINNLKNIVWGMNRIIFFIKLISIKSDFTQMKRDHFFAVNNLDMT